MYAILFRKGVDFMKKSICLFLSVFVLISSICLVGCGSDDVRGEISNNVNTEPAVPTENTTGADVNVPEETVDNTPVPTETEPVQEETEPAFALGSATGSTYRNDFLGISCTVPENWELYSDEQILAMNNITSSYLDEETAKQLENAAIIYDMYAQYLDEGSTVSINLEKLNVVQLLSIDIKESLEAQIPAIVTAYENMGYTDTNVEYQKITVDGKEFDGLVLSAKIQGMDFSMVTFVFQKGSYLANVSVGSLLADTVTEILNSFTVE